MDPLKLNTVFNKRVSAANRVRPQIKKLSILDNSAAFSPKNRAFYAYEALNVNEKLSPERIETTLSEFLSIQPFWGGQLEHTRFDPEGGHQHRWGCLQIRFGENNDPGVAFSFVTSDLALDQIVPSFEGAFNSERVFKRDELPFDAFFNQEKIATEDPTNFEGCPILSVQMIRFACGGVTIAFIVPHYLGDSASFTHVIEDIAKINRGEEPLPRFFDCETIDGIAGNLDPEKVDRERILRHLKESKDMWASLENAPDFMVPSCNPPAHLAHLAEPYGKPVDWYTLDFAATQCSHTFFSPVEICRIYEAASEGGRRISHLDAFNAHLWQETSIANKVQEKGGEIEFGFPLDLRRRMNLPSGQIGNIVTSRFTGLMDVNISIGEAASAIRTAILTVTPESIKDLILCMAFELTPTRYLPWAPKGKNTTVLTSWMSDDIVGIDFGCGLPRYFDTRPSFPIPNFHILTTLPSDDQTVNWYEKGVLVTSFFKAPEMERFCNSKSLRKYRK